MFDICPILCYQARLHEIECLILRTLHLLSSEKGNGMCGFYHMSKALFILARISLFLSVPAGLHC